MKCPDDVGLEPPARWKRGRGLSPPAVPPAEASEAVDHDDADPEPGHVEAGGVEKLGALPMKMRKKLILDPRLKNWFLCFAELQQARHGWERRRGRLGRREGSARASWRSTRTHRGAGRPSVLSEAQVTFLTGVVAKVTARVPF